MTRVAATERGTPSVALSTAGQTGLMNYLEGPVRGQLRQEWGYVPEEVTFVYGHTHKPFVDRRSVPGFPGPVSVANTGGWVVDTAVPAPVQAGVAVLVSENLDTASLQFYRQDAGSDASPRPAPAAAGRRAAVRLARRAGGAHRPGGTAVDGSGGVRGGTRRPAPPPPDGHRGAPRRHAILPLTSPDAARATIVEIFLVMETTGSVWRHL